MTIKHTSHFKDQTADINHFQNWVSQLEKANDREYERIELTTALGKTQVYGLNTKADLKDTIVIFPGARTTCLFWDLDKGLDHFNHKMRIFMVETNGLPNLSDGSTPDIKSLDYGVWATEVLDQLNIKKTYVTGASFGGLICMKLAMVSPDRIQAAFLLNPGCLQPFSLSIKNLYYNLLPIISPSEKNVRKFIDKAVFSKPNHRLSDFAEKMLVDYEVFAISRYKDNTQKPYYMDKQLEQVTSQTYLLVGEKDLLFPYQKSIANAQRQIKNLKEVRVFNDVGHGIETYAEALQFVGEKIREGNNN